MMGKLSKKILIALILGINSGLPAALIASLFRVLLSDYKVDITYIGLVSLISVPFSFKYLWAPIMDNTELSFISKYVGRRKSWIVVSQVFLMFFIILTGSINPSKYPYALGISVLLVAFFSASSDIVIDAFRIEIFDKNEQGTGATAVIYGYRIGMIISGVGGLYLASYLNWYQTFIKEDKYILILLFIAVYKLSDAYLGAMTMPFLIEEGYSKIEIANAVKTIGLIATILGTAVGGYFTYRLSKGGALLFGEVLAMISNLPFLLLLKFHNLVLLAIVNGFENFASAISNIALVAYISNLSKNKYAATYYAVLTSFAMFGRSILSASSGFAVSSLGWCNFFILSALLSIPCFIIMYYLFFKNKNIA